MSVRDQGWHDNNEEARAQEEYEYRQWMATPCSRCHTGERPDMTSELCLDCMNRVEYCEWLERRVA